MLSRMTRNLLMKREKDAFDWIRIFGFKSRSEQKEGKDSVEKIELIKRQEVLLEEIGKVRDENEELESALAEKQNEFR